MSEDYIPSQIILDYYSNPVNYGVLKSYDLMIIGSNKNCSDKVSLFVKFSKNKKSIHKIFFQHTGCVISKVGACVLTEIVLNKCITEILELRPELILEGLGDVLKTRIQCAYLAVNLLKRGLKEFVSGNQHTPKDFFFEI